MGDSDVKSRNATLPAGIDAESRSLSTHPGILLFALGSFLVQLMALKMQSVIRMQYAFLSNSAHFFSRTPQLTVQGVFIQSSDCKWEANIVARTEP